MRTTKLPDDEDHPKRTRLEDEVLEILQKNDRPISFSDHVRRKAIRQRQAARPRTTRLQQNRFWPVAPFVAAFALAFIGLSIRDTSALLATLLAWASVVLLFLPIINRIRRPANTQIKRWRGRDVDLRPPRRDWIGDLRDRFSGRPRL